jgi:hypothetical protein
MNAPRALPTWSGPVGLAETNSTLTVLGETGSTWPQASGSARIPSTILSRAVGRSRTFRKPGGATSAASTGELDPGADPSRTSFAARRVATSSGARLYGRASFMARLVEKSPCSGLAGRSTSMTGRFSSSSAERAPSSMARAHARSMACRTWVRNGGGITRAIVPAWSVGRGYRCRSWVVGPGVLGGPIVAAPQRNRGSMGGY